MENQNLQITSIDQLKNYKSGQIVELPPFGDGQPFVARLRRPSMMSLAKRGKIPNELLNSANSLFERGPQGLMQKGKFDDETMTKLFDIIDVICEASFVEPLYKDLKDIGIELTDDQYMFIFNYTQNGVQALDSFRPVG
ncbi:MAG: esterase [Gammaproteobacteria bacterium]|nr:esterase [Gammaproteobacteria bacterium]